MNNLLFRFWGTSGRSLTRIVAGNRHAPLTSIYLSQGSHHTLSKSKSKVCSDGRVELYAPPRRGMSGGADHVTLWTAEKVVSAALVPLLPIALLSPNAPADYLLAFTLVLHSHWGIEAIVVDYVRASIFGPLIPKVSVALVYGLSAMTLGGLFYFIYSDVGIGQAIRLLWKL